MQIKWLAPVIVSGLAITGCQTLQPIAPNSAKPTLQSSDAFPKVISVVPTNFPNFNLTELSGKLIFIYLTGTGETRQAQLIETNIDGSQPRVLYAVNGTIMSLSASRVGDRLIFMVQQAKSYPKVVILDRTNLQITDVSAKRTNNFSGTISPDGGLLLLSNSQAGNPEIFLTDSKGNIQQQLTHQNAIDVAPVWLPDGKSFIFTSDKAKFLQPQLYQYFFEQQQFFPLNLKGKSNAIARISPLGNHMTYVSNNSQGMLMDMATKKTTVINFEGLAEPANFSPDGNFLIFSSKNGIKIMLLPSFEQVTYQKSHANWAINFADAYSQKFTIREPIWLKR